MDTLDGLLTVDHEAGDLEGQIYRGLRDAILAGRLVCRPTTLPATRPLAHTIGRRRVPPSCKAFERLRAEGYIGAVQGGYTQVSPLLAPPVEARTSPPGLSPLRHIQAPHQRRTTQRQAFVKRRAGPLRFSPLPPGRAASAPERARSACTTLAMAPRKGLPELRAAILAHVAETRGVVAGPGSDSSSCPSTSVAIDLIARLIAAPRAIPPGSRSPATPRP